jgi:predicted enzyme related to lactoylglutathione lyase
MLATAPIIAFVATTDLDRARRFYEETLELPVSDVSPLPDIAATVGSLAARGVRFNRYAGMEQNVDGIWTTPSGDRVAWFTDPDGNTLSLTQFA